MESVSITPTNEVIPLQDMRFNDAQLVAAAFLASYKGLTREGYALDLKLFFQWCRQHNLDILKLKRPHIELFTRYCEEERKLKPASIARRLGTITGYYRIAVIDGWIEASPAEYVRRPKVPFESQRLGLSHLQFEAYLAASRKRPDDEALVAMMGLLGLRVSEACAVRVEDLGYEHGHRTLRVVGKGGKIVVTPLPVAAARAIEGAVGNRTSGPLVRNRAGEPLNRAAATRIVKRLAKQIDFPGKLSPHSLRHTYVTTMLDAGVSLRDVQIAARHSDTRTTTRYDRARINLDRHGNYVLAAFMGGA
jgi:integrase/recombinase XerD